MVEEIRLDVVGIPARLKGLGPLGATWSDVQPVGRILDFMTLSPLGAVLMPALHITPAQFGLVVSVYAFSAGTSGFLAAGFADRFDRKKFLLFFYAGFDLPIVRIHVREGPAALERSLCGGPPRPLVLRRSRCALARRPRH